MYFILLVLITLGGVTLRGVIVNVLALVDKWIHIIRLIRYTFSITPANVLLFFDMCKSLGENRFRAGGFMVFYVSVVSRLSLGCESVDDAGDTNYFFSLIIQIYASGYSLMEGC